jgi:aryl-alcohol dehydrogenase-like predicted oxidoreductase
MNRAIEHEILPMAREHGMALAPWDVLASGKLRSDAEEARREKSGENGRDLKINDNGWKRTEQERKMSNALEKVAKEVGVESVTAGNLNYTLLRLPERSLIPRCF